VGNAGGVEMMDVLYVGLVLVFFALSWALIESANRL
jgi:hypothetical protein